jgi:hypothetical protein
LLHQPSSQTKLTIISSSATIYFLFSADHESVLSSTSDKFESFIVNVKMLRVSLRYLILDSSCSMLRVSPAVNPALWTECKRVAVARRNLRYMTDIHYELRGDLSLYTLLALSKPKHTVCILAHTIHKSILRENVDVWLAAGDHFDQNIVAAQFRLSKKNLFRFKT